MRPVGHPTTSAPLAGSSVASQYCRGARFPVLCPLHQRGLTTRWLGGAPSAHQQQQPSEPVNKPPAHTRPAPPAAKAGSGSSRSTPGVGQAGSASSSPTGRTGPSSSRGSNTAGSQQRNLDTRPPPATQSVAAAKPHRKSSRRPRQGADIAALAGRPHSSAIGQPSSSTDSSNQQQQQAVHQPGRAAPAAAAVGGAHHPVAGAPRFSSPAAAQLCQQLCSCQSCQQVQHALSNALHQLQHPLQEQQQQQQLTQQPLQHQQDPQLPTAVQPAVPEQLSPGDPSSSPSAAPVLDAATTAALLPHIAVLAATTTPSFLEDQALQQLLPWLYTLAAQHLPSLKPPAAQAVLLALSQLKYVDGPALSQLLEEGRSGVGEWRLAATSQLLLALARGQVRPSNAWLAAVMQGALQQLPSASLSSLSALLWGLVQLGVRPTPTWMRAFTTGAIAAASSAAATRHPTHPASSRDTARRANQPVGVAAQSRGSSGRPTAPQQPQQQSLVSDIALLLSALVQARLAAPAALSSALLAAAAPQLAAAGPTAAVELLCAMGALQLVPGDPWFSSYCAATLPVVTQYSTWQQASSVLALGRLQQAADAAEMSAQRSSSSGLWLSQQQLPPASLTFAVVFQQQLRQQQQAAAESLPPGTAAADTPHRQALLQLPVAQQWLQQLLATAQQQLPRFAARELADLLRGLALLQLPLPPQLLAALMAEVTQKLPRFTAAGLASVLDSSVALQQLAAATPTVGMGLTVVDQQLSSAGPGADPPGQQQQRQAPGELPHQQWWAACLDAVLVKLPVLSIEEVRQVLVAVAAAAAAAAAAADAAASTGAAAGPGPSEQDALQQAQQQQQQQPSPVDLAPPTQRWVAAVASHAHGKLTLLSVEGLLQLQQALTALSHESDAAWMAAWLAAAEQQLEDISPQQLLQLLQVAAGQQQVVLSTAWLSAAAAAVSNLQQQSSWEQQLQLYDEEALARPQPEVQLCEQALLQLRAAAAADQPAAHVAPAVEAWAV